MSLEDDNHRLLPIINMARFQLFYLLSTLVLFGYVEAQETTTSDLTKLPQYHYKPRTFILTDILNEPDDQMSVVRYLTYSNEFETKGLVATTSVSMPNETHPEAIELIIRAYGEVVSNLNKHVHPNATFSPAEDLLKLVRSGPVVNDVSSSRRLSTLFIDLSSSGLRPAGSR